MQLGQLLAVLNPTPAPGTANIASANADGGNADQTFAQLLGDAGAKNAASDQGKQSGNAHSDYEGDTASLTASTALAAQELNEKPPEDSAALAAKIAQPITPDEAAIMLARLESKGASGAFMQQLKQSLIAIRDGSGQESIGSLVQKLVENKHAATPADIAVIIKQTLHALAPESSATDEQAEAASNNATDNNVLSALVQSLQASFFRTVDGKPHAASSDTPQQERKESWEMVEIIPMSSILVMNAVPLQAGAATPDAEAAISAIGDGASRIPSLAFVPKDRDVHTLPDVNLPAVSAAEKNNPALDALASLKSTNDTRLSAALDVAKQSVAARGDATAGAAAATLSNYAAIAMNALAAAAPVAIKSSATEKSMVNPVSVDAVSKLNQLKPLSAGISTGSTSVVVAETEPSAEDRSVDVSFDNVLTEVTLSGAEAPVAAQRNTDVASVKLAAYVPLPVPEQVHVAVTRAAKDGVKDVTIQLDPIDLGRVEVKMFTGADGQTQITFMVDKPSTLDLLARSAHGLERSLQEAGVKTDAGNMQFNLRQQPQSADTNAGGNGNRQSSNQSMRDGAVASVGSTNAAAISAGTTRNYTLNIRDGLDIRA